MAEQGGGAHGRRSGRLRSGRLRSGRLMSAAASRVGAPQHRGVARSGKAKRWRTVRLDEPLALRVERLRHVLADGHHQRRGPRGRRRAGRRGRVGRRPDAVVEARVRSAARRGPGALGLPVLGRIDAPARARRAANRERSLLLVGGERRRRRVERREGGEDREHVPRAGVARTNTRRLVAKIAPLQL